MKESTFHVLVLLMVVLIFSIPFVSFSQQNSVILEARVAAEQDAEADANKDVSKLLCFSAGCVLSAVFFLPSPYGYLLPPAGIIGSYSYRPGPPPSRLIGKSPEYISAYTTTYKSKRGNIQALWTSAGCLTGCVVITVGLGAAAATQ